MRLVRAVCLLTIGAVATVVSAQEDMNRRPTISHDPVRMAVRGQPVTVLARVADDSGHVKSVTLFYSLSRDAAPFRTPMKSSGTSMYYGTIPAGVLDNAAKISYYIEAMDYVDAAQETPWHTVDVRDTAAAAAAAPARQPTPVIQQPVAASESGGGGPNWTTIGLIGAGAAVVIGGAVLLANSGGDDDDSSSSSGGASGSVQAGQYNGDVTTCVALNQQAQSCETHAMSLTVGADGAVSSSTLRNGVTMSAVLQGTSFTLLADLAAVSTGAVGQVSYAGSVVGTRIVGSISGNTTAGTNQNTHSGTFSATLQ